MFGLDLGNWGSALQTTGSGFQLPGNAATGVQAPANVNSFQLPADTGEALKLTGASYQLPSTSAQTQVTQPPPTGAPAPPAAPAAPAVQQPAADTEVAGPAKGNAAGNMIGGLFNGVMGQKSDTSGGTQGDKNQSGAFNKLGSIFGAVAKFYTGDFMGAAGNVKNMSGQ